MLSAQLDLVAGGVPALTLSMRWNDAEHHSIALIQGQIDGATVQAQGIVL